MTTPGTEWSYPRPPQSLNDSKRSLSSRNRRRTALRILQVGLSTRRVPQFLPVYSAWRVRLWVSCCCRSPTRTKIVRYPSAGPSPYQRRRRWFVTRGTAQDGRSGLPPYRGCLIFQGCGELCVPGSQSRLVYRQASPFSADRIACAWRGAPLAEVKHVIVFSVVFWA